MLNRAEIPPIDPNLCWTVRKIPAGTSLDCWTAARVFPVWVHWSQNRNCPCLRRLTCDRLNCHQCGAKVGVKLIGYQPVFDRNDEKLVIVCSHQTTAELDHILPGSPVRLTRGLGDKTRLKLGRQDDTPTLRALDKKFTNRKPVDLAPWLVLLWKDSRLKDFTRAAFVEESTDPEYLPVNSDIVARALGNRDRLAD